MIVAKNLCLMVILLVLLPLISNAKEVLSLNPLYTEKDVVVGPMIEGAWYDESGSGFVLSCAGDNFYHLVFTLDGVSIKAEAVMVKIADRLILDIYPLFALDPKYDFMLTMVWPHTFYDISVQNATL